MGKKAYDGPRLEVLGKLTDLTQAGQTIEGGDAIFTGSVDAPGLNDKGPPE